MPCMDCGNDVVECGKDPADLCLPSPPPPGGWEHVGDYECTGKVKVFVRRKGDNCLVRLVPIGD